MGVGGIKGWFLATVRRQHPPLKAQLHGVVLRYEIELLRMQMTIIRESVVFRSGREGVYRLTVGSALHQNTIFDYRQLTLASYPNTDVYGYGAGGHGLTGVSNTSCTHYPVRKPLKEKRDRQKLACMRVKYLPV